MKADVPTAQDASRFADQGRYTSLHRLVRAVLNSVRTSFRVPAAVRAGEAEEGLEEARETAEAAAEVVEGNHRSRL